MSPPHNHRVCSHRRWHSAWPGTGAARRKRWSFRRVLPQSESAPANRNHAASVHVRFRCLEWLAFDAKLTTPFRLMTEKTSHKRALRQAFSQIDRISGQFRSCGAAKPARSEPGTYVLGQKWRFIWGMPAETGAARFLGRTLTMGGDPHCGLPWMVISITIVGP